FLAALAFVAAALLQVQIDKTLPVFPAAKQTQVKITNLGTDNATINFLPQLQTENVMPMTSTDYITLEASQLQSLSITYGNMSKVEAIELLNETRHTLAIKS
ncbi:S15A1 protein, partial [Trogon melanurus]|nr:S15A1 protein [Trogon melanurus]